MKVLVATLAGLLTTAVSLAACASELTPEAKFSEAATLMEAGHFAEAVPILEELAQAHPTANVFWNLGIATAETAAHDKALAAWHAFRGVAPDDWRGRAKLIQTFQALGDMAARDAERTRLLELWRSGNDDHLSGEELYCREQIRIGERKVMAFEYFEAAGQYMVIYSFSIASGPGAGKLKVSLGSYEATNQIAWELGQLPRGKRLYHLDLYDEGRHQTFGFYDELPSYDQVRSEVVKILAGSAAPLSESKPGG